MYGARQKCDQRGSDNLRKPEQGNHPPLFDSAHGSYGSNDENKASTGARWLGWRSDPVSGSSRGRLGSAFPPFAKKREGWGTASLRRAKRLHQELSYRTARDILWTLMGSDVYRMLVRERGWSSQKYQDWLADTLVRSLLSPD